MTFTRPPCFPRVRTNRFAIILGPKTISDQIKRMQCCAVLAPRRVTKLSGSPEICCCLLACASQQWCEPLLVCIYVSGYIEITTRRDEVNDPGEGEKKDRLKNCK